MIDNVLYFKGKGVQNWQNVDPVISVQTLKCEMHTFKTEKKKKNNSKYRLFLQ